MRRLEVRYRKSAADDLARLFFYLRDRGAGTHVADADIEKIRTACRRIGDAPEGGMLRDDFGPGLRTRSFERRAVIVYRIEPRYVRIVNVFHRGRDVETFYGRQRSRRENEG